jgi:hypothetical protein
MKYTAIVLFTILAIWQLNAQTNSEKSLLYSNKFSILAGLIQPIVLKGGNVEITYTTKRLIFDYSHGFNLNVAPLGDIKTQKLTLAIPYSTGFGIGYRINSFLDIRVEPKLHSWDIFYENDAQTADNKIHNYKTFTLGLGVYYRYFPFRNSKSKILQGITTATSVRWWPNIGSTLSNDEFIYQNSYTGKQETIKANNIGIVNTPFIFNISIGYTFGGK